MIIYKLTFSNGKSYIGQTVRKMETRLSQHRTQARAKSLLPVHCAWRKYGEPDCVSLGSYDDMDALHAAEIAAIEAHGTLTPGGYNISFGGETAPSKSSIVAEKIRAKATGRIKPQAAKEKHSVASKACWGGPEYRQKVADGVAAAWTPERRARAGELAAARKGEKRSEAAKANMKGRVFSAETRAKMSAAAKARKRIPASDETRAKVAAGVANSWTNPEIAALRIAAIKEAKKSEVWTEERREALRERNRVRFAQKRLEKGII